MRTLIIVLVCAIMFSFVGCKETVKEDDPKPVEIKVADVLKKINDPEVSFPVSDIAKLDETKETELLDAIAKMKFTADEVISIATIRKNQGKYEPALRWLGLNIKDSDKYIEIRYRKAEVLYLLGKPKEAYILCKIETLPDELTPEYRQQFGDLMKKIESELSTENKGSEKN